MSTIDYTPGPWSEFQPSGMVHSTRIVANDSTIIARLDEWKGETDIAEAAANARLIAAAPELLEIALQFYPIVARLMAGTTDGTPMLAKAREVFAKVTTS